MKTLNRDGIQRMIGSGSGSVGGGVSASPESLAGYATQMWVNGNYVSIKFFSKLFQALDENGDPIDPNDMDTVIDSIQSMFGFWTNAYLSALGQNSEGGEVELTLASLADVDVSTVSNGDALVWNAALRKWVPGQGGMDLTAMWAALGSSSAHQIDASHLATALTGYATETWVGNQGYITGSALNGYATESWVGTQISDMATQTWVGNNYLSQTDAATTYLSKTDAANTYLSIAFFARLFRAYNGSTAVNPNDTTSTIDNIKAMFGFWTEQYISALGNSGGGSAYVTMDQVWTALGNATNEQINISHLTTALSGYATTTALALYNPTNNFKTINGYSIIGTGDINVGGGGGAYLPLSGGTLTSTLRQILILNQNASGSQQGPYISFLMNGTEYANMGYNTNSGTFIGNLENGGHWLEMKDTSIKYNGWDLITSNNIGSQSVNYATSAGTATDSTKVLKVGDTMTGSLTINAQVAYPLSVSSTQTECSILLHPNVQTNTEKYVMGCYDGTTSGKLSFFLWDSTLNKHILHFENGRCSINNGNAYPSYNLEVNGTTGLVSSDRKILSLNQNATGGVGPYISFNLNSRVVAECGYNTGSGAFLGNYEGGVGYFLEMKGTSIQYNKWNLITSNNIGSQSVSYATSAGTATDSTKVLKVGDTMTGSLTINAQVAYPLSVSSTQTECSILLHPNVQTNTEKYVMGCYDGTTSGKLSFFLWDSTLSKHILHFENGRCSINNGSAYPSYNLEVNGTFYTSGNSSIGGTLGVTGATTLSSTLGVTGATTLSSTLGVTGATTLSSTLGVSGATTMSGKLTMNKSNIELVNTSSNDGIWVEMKGVSYDWGIATGSGNVNRGIIDFGGAGWMLYFDASNTYCEYGNFICSGGVTALSDVRHKRIVSNTDITIEQIARMRSVKFLWNDDRNDDAIHVGSIAQDWQSILPEVVIRKDDKDGTLSLNYGVAALVSVITTARKVVDHERRIKELEKENERLRFEVKQLKIA